MTYADISPGEWVQPRRSKYKLACCDCGLVHTMNFRTRKRKIQFQMFRDNRATASLRRHLGVKVR